jgi:GDP-L-fucose synthase
MSFYAGRRVLVTGGTGFIGANLAAALAEAGAKVQVASRHSRPDQPGEIEHVSCDLLDPAACRAAMRGREFVFHLAAFGYGIGANLTMQADLFTANTLINVNALEAARLEGVERFLLCSSSSVYDGDAQVLDDTKPWSGDPHPSEFGFGWAKRTAETHARVLAKHAGMKVAIVRPSNPYGPMDVFDQAKSHVVPAMIMRALAGENPFTVWGTGRARRSFVYVSDAVEAMMLAVERLAVCDPVNIAGTEKTSIADLAQIVLDACGAGGTEVRFDASKPEGHPGRFPTVEKARAALGWEARTPLREGVRRTVQWYIERHGRTRRMSS